MPTDSKGKWILDYEKQMDKDTIDLILKVQLQLHQLGQTLQKADEPTKKKITKEVAKYEEYLNEIRKDTVYFSEATTLDNIETIGIKAIKNWKRTLSDLEFRTSILNERVIKIANGFYGLLDEDIHGYEAPNYEKVDQITADPTYNFTTTKKNSDWDNDVQDTQPLEIGCDYNAAINSMVIGQTYNDEYRILNSLFVKHPFRLKDLVKKFDRYYKNHPTKRVKYYYDHTAVGTNASSDVSFADEWIDELNKLGWKVTPVNIGQASSHHSRYHMWQNTFKGDDERLFKFKYNKTNCTSLYTSMSLAPVKQMAGKFQKDKASERNPNIPPEEATHLSEALDCLWSGANEMSQTTGEFIDNAVI